MCQKNQERYMLQSTQLCLSMEPLLLQKDITASQNTNGKIKVKFCGIKEGSIKHTGTSKFTLFNSTQRIQCT